MRPPIENPDQGGRHFTCRFHWLCAATDASQRAVKRIEL
jgi:hypothetical protein